MPNNLKFRVRTPSILVAALIALLTGTAGQALASGRGYMDSLPPGLGRSIGTSPGPAFITGSVGSMATTTIPGRGGQGLPMSNGNGTGTLFVPGGVPQVAATPK
jgi:hypothetical protein